MHVEMHLSVFLHLSMFLTWIMCIYLIKVTLCKKKQTYSYYI